MINNKRELICGRCGVVHKVKVNDSDIIFFQNNGKVLFGGVNTFVVANERKEGTWLGNNNKHHCNKCFRTKDGVYIPKGKYKREFYLRKRLPKGISAVDKILYVSTIDQDNKYVNMLVAEFNYLKQNKIFDEDTLG